MAPKSPRSGLLDQVRERAPFPPIFEVEVEAEVPQGVYRVGWLQGALAPSFCPGGPPLIGPRAAMLRCPLRAPRWGAPWIVPLRCLPLAAVGLCWLLLLVSA